MRGLHLIARALRGTLWLTHGVRWCAGKLDARLPAVLRILSAFGGTYRNRSPAGVHSTLSTLFDDVAVVPVTKEVSSGPPLDSAKHAQLLKLVRQGFAKGRFSDGGAETLPASWEDELRALLQQQDVQVRGWSLAPVFCVGG